MEREQNEIYRKTLRDNRKYCEQNPRKNWECLSNILKVDDWQFSKQDPKYQTTNLKSPTNPGGIKKKKTIPKDITAKLP